MKVLFLGGLFGKEMEEEILNKSKGPVQYAANSLQWKIIDGFINIDEIELEIVSAPFIGTYPKDYDDLFVKKFSSIYTNDVKVNYVSFCNLWGFRNISRKNALIREIKYFLLDKDSEKVVVVYSPHTPFLQAAAYAKQKDPSIHICLIVPDLPQYMNLYDRKSIIYRILKIIDIKIFKKLCKEVDSFVLLTEYMKDMLEVGNRPCVVIEGVVDVAKNVLDEGNEKSKLTSNIKRVVYTGTLNKKFGIVNLIKAFSEIENPNVILEICGKGDAEILVSEYAKKDTRIHYLGQLSHEESLKLQKNATVLVNPRSDDEEFTKYSFPSKNMEYLLSGNPVIAYKLKGIPDEYDDYIFYIEENSVEGIKNKIIEVLNLPSQERYEFGEKAKKFVVENKNKDKASLKIFNMIKKNLK